MKLNPQELQNLFTKICKFDQTLGLNLSMKEGQLTYKMEVSERHLSRPGISHGGAIAAMMDAVLGITALQEAVSHGRLCSTVEFKINYLQPAKLGQVLEGYAKIDFYGKSLIVTSGEIMDGDKIIAKGQGTFNTYALTQTSFRSLTDLPSEKA